MVKALPRVRRTKVRALESSAMLLAVLGAGPAFAQCSPDPTQSNITTTCIGTDLDGLQVTTSGTTVDVTGAVVSNGSRPAMSFEIPFSSSSYAYSTLAVSGRIDGGSQAGVQLLRQESTDGYSYSSANLTMTIAAGGSVSGANGVVIGQVGNRYGSTTATIDNSGTITGTDGYALLSNNSAYAGFSSVINRASGTIGAISGAIGTLTNAGMIDGGTRSAIDRGTSYSGVVYGYNTTNSGTITSNSLAATLSNANFGTLTNSGTISNLGAGAAITASSLTLNNGAAGRITTAGTMAVRVDDGLTLINAGVITGDVSASSAANYYSNNIDNSAGTITGNVRFGQGNDTLTVGYADGGIRTGISGTIDGGDGTDRLRVRFANDSTLSSALALPTGFEELALTPDTKMTATLADGFTLTGKLRFAGGGTVVNRTTLSGAGTFIVNDFGTDAGGGFVNAGTITATAGQSNGFPVYAIQLGSASRFENSGTITADGNAVSSSSQGSFVNSGTIVAVGTAVSLFGSSFENSGTIRSTGEVAVSMSGSSGSKWTNKGLIEGATSGVRLSGTLTNSGTITATGTGVILDFYGVLDNQAGGIITGGTRGIGPSGSFPAYNVRVANAGTINGDVTFGSPTSTGFSYNQNIYFALPGGVLNGNLTLGSGDLLVVEMPDSDGARFAGVTGTLSARNAGLRYRIRTDGSATLPASGDFATLGYEVLDKATLTLTGAASTRALSLSGQGTIDLTADIAATNMPAITTPLRTLAPGEDYTDNALTIVSHGILSLTATDANIDPSAAVRLGSTDTFTNMGTISVGDQRDTRYTATAAITGGKNVINSGRIVQKADGAGVNGVTGFTSLTNSGTIEVAGTAVLLAYNYTGNASVVENSGRIASTVGAAILQDNSFAATIRNLAGGTIVGGTGQPAIRTYAGQLTNAGSIVGDVDLGYTSYGGRSNSSSTYSAAGGTLTGNLRFGDGDDILVVTDGSQTGITGTIDGGGGYNIYRHAFTRSATITLGEIVLPTFRSEDVQAIGEDTIVTVQATGTRTAFNLVGDGQIVNMVNVDGDVALGQSYAPWYYSPTPETLAAFTNQATVRGRVAGQTARFDNSGTIGRTNLERAAVSLFGKGDLYFTNSGSIQSDGNEVSVELGADRGKLTAVNSGAIAQGFRASVNNASGYYLPPNAVPPEPVQPIQLSLRNSGTISAERTAVSLAAEDYQAAGGNVSLDNSGTIEASGAQGVGANVGFYRYFPSPTSAVETITVVNSGTIRANGGGFPTTYFDYPDGHWLDPVVSVATGPATALNLFGNGTAAATITNAAAGLIEATGELSTAIMASGGAMDLTNAGTIRGGSGATLDAGDRFALWIGTSYLAGAVHSVGATDDRIVNTGTITGSIALAGGNDQIENYGRIDGNVFLGSGDDRFLHRASATLIGTVDGGDGNDNLVIDATGGGTVNGDQFVNFEGFSQTGQGDVTYAGAFRFDTLGVAGGTVTVATGQTLASTGAITVTGSDAAETVLNNGTIAGSVALGGGNDTFVNAGRVLGAVALGDGDDSFVEGPGAQVAGGVDGGVGTNLYRVLLAGDRSGIGQRSNFQQLAVTGTGALTLTLDGNFETVALAGTGLNLTLAGHRVGAVTGSGAAEQLRLDGDVASIALDAGDDLLALGITNAAGRYDGGAGVDTLRFTAPEPIVLSGLAIGFENVALTGDALTVTGTLGSIGAPLNFGDGNLALTIGRAGTLAGIIDLGAGSDSLRVSAGSVLQGVIAGGAGADIATFVLAGDRMLAASTLTGFETLATEGAGTLSLTGAHVYDRVDAATDLTVAEGSSLIARQVAFTGGDQRFTITGTFAGAVDGGAGADSIALSGGTSMAPIALTNVANVETLAVNGGYTTVSGQAAFGMVDMAAGRLVGLAGSTVAASRFLVRQGATFGSAGTVNGNVTVAGILSPGASPGTMTVNGNVVLNNGSVSLFELTPTISDSLIVNGTMTIDSGSTLQFVSSGALRPGTSHDLIVASGGITGGYTTVQKPADLFGFIVQRADRIQLIGQFAGDARFSPQVSRSIAYANATLVRQPATSTLFAALPALLTGSGSSNPQSFAQITPEAYASATQIGVDNALGLTQAARGPAFSTTRDEAGAFTFGQMIGQRHQLGSDTAQGTGAARTRGNGILGGIGYGDRRWMVGAFAGWLDTRQSIASLAASTDADGVVAGVHGRYSSPNGFGFGASILYDGTEARTRRALPGAASAFARYTLHSWVGDLSIHYAAELADGWALTPRAGLTYLRTTRANVDETGASPFALSVARVRHVAGFADAGATFGRSDASNASFRPFVTLGARYQIEGAATRALAGYAGGDLGLVALGASRASLVGTAMGGVAYRFTTGLDLYANASTQTGRDDHQETVSAGLRLRF